mmetsp:Transcript_9564/g.35449  ORF Transcript_9564/g.35449 Transcript_9564/m.35449 type:complete len:235 (-) Transcript_9564:2848-3552(-)
MLYLERCGVNDHIVLVLFSVIHLVGFAIQFLVELRHLLKENCSFLCPQITTKSQGADDISFWKARIGLPGWVESHNKNVILQIVTLHIVLVREIIILNHNLWISLLEWKQPVAVARPRLLHECTCIEKWSLSLNDAQHLTTVLLRIVFLFFTVHLDSYQITMKGSVSRIETINVNVLGKSLNCDICLKEALCIDSELSLKDMSLGKKYLYTFHICVGLIIRSLLGIDIGVIYFV